MAKNKTKKIVQIGLIVGGLASLYFVPWLLVKAWILPLPDSVQEQLDEAVDHGFDGVLVYVDQKGRSPQSYASGWHDRDAKIPADPHALFKIASISKLYNAVAITKLVKSGRLSLDKNLVHYFPDLEGRVENADKITLRHMVQHRSGIPNYTDFPGYWSQDSLSSEESLALVLDQPANFEPGEDYEYCNTNYLLLSDLMRNELGYPVFEYLEEEILIPLNLHKTYDNLSEVNLEDVMSGYHVGHPYDLKEEERGMLATAQDVGVFLRALNDGSLFKTGEQEIYNSIYELEHGGWVPGYQSFANYDADLDAVIVAFYSTTDSDLYYWNLSEIINNRIAKIIEE